MSSPEISLIIPLYNAEATVQGLIDSIKVQTFEYFEAIFVNDGSTDASASLVADAAIRDDRIRLLVQPNAGPGVARNHGMEAARGRYIMFADADDRLMPDAMTRAFGCAERMQADIVVFQARHLDARTDKHHSSPDRWDPTLFPEVFAGIDCPDHLFSQFRNWPWDKLFRRSFLMRNGLRFPALHRTEDLPFTCKALSLATRIAPLDEELYLYRVNNELSSTQTRDRHPLDFLHACEDFHAFLVAHGLFETFHADYLRWIGLCVFVNLTELRTYEGFCEVFDALKAGGLARLELLNVPDQAFTEPIHGQVIRGIAEGDCNHLLFTLWRLDSDKARAFDPVVAERDKLANSSELRVGRAVVALPQALLHALHRG